MRYLKKTGFIITTALFLTLFIACGGNNDRQSPPGQTPPSDKTPQPDPKPPKDPDTPVTPVAKDIQPDELRALIESGDVEVYLKSNGNDIAFIGGKDLSGIFPYKVDSVEKAIDALYNVKTLLGINDPSSEFIGRVLYNNPFGITYKLQQIYNDIPVYAREIIINTDISGQVISLTSDYYRDIDVDTTPARFADAADAEAKVIDVINKTGGSGAGATITPPSELVIYTLNGPPEVLAWRVTAGTSGTNNDYFIDLNGVIINVISNIRAAAVSAAGYDLSDEHREFTVNQTGGKYELLDPARNIAIYNPVYDNNNGDYKGEILITGDNNAWPDNAAVSAMSNISAVYDYYKEKLYRDSIDGTGERNGAVIHFKNNEKNTAYKGSFWNGSRMVFGDGEPYIGALDVVAHEFTHGVVDHTAGFVYQGQSGALHESFADIFGELIEMDNKYISDNDPGVLLHRWIHGQGLEKPRSLENPNDSRQPKEVGGLYYTNPLCLNPSPETDFCGVHINSGIVSHAAYLMWASREFTKTELAQLWYLSLYRLTPYSEFASVRYALTDSARVLRLSARQIEAINSRLNEVKVDAREWQLPEPQDTEPPTIPQNLTVTMVTMTSVRLTWSPSKDNVGVAGYRVYRVGSSAKTSLSTTYDDSGLSSSTEYCYQVSAYDKAGNESGKSIQVCATTTASANTDTEAPTVPQNLTATEISSTEIELSWDESTDNVGVAGYRIYRDNFDLISTSLTFHIDEDLYPSTEYCYRVSAYDAAGNESVKSIQACATTDDEGHLSGTSVAPQNLTATAVSSTEIELSWDPPTDDADVSYYNIYRDDSYIFDTTLLSHNDSDGLSPSTRYCYKVSAFYFLIESEKSAEACTETFSDDNPFSGDGINMAYVPAGTFTMGCTAEQLSEGCDNKEKPAHTVTLSDFYIGRYEVTQKLWKDVMGSDNNPSIFRGDNLPVENVTFDDVKEFIRKLNIKTGRTGTGNEYRLPTEAEWEYAARGGGNNGYRYSGSNDIGEAAWYLSNSATETYPLGTTHHVGTKKANGLGLYDMSGNVSEWVSDIYGEYGATPQTNPKGPAEGLYLLSRGGSFTNSEWRVRLSFRNNVQNDSRTPAYKSKDLGFRLAADR